MNWGSRVYTVLVERLFAPPREDAITAPDPDDIRWAQARRDQLLRQAKELQVDVDLEQTRKWPE